MVLGHTGLDKPGPGGCEAKGLFHVGDRANEEPFRAVDSERQLPRLGNRVGAVTAFVARPFTRISMDRSITTRGLRRSCSDGTLRQVRNVWQTRFRGVTIGTDGQSGAWPAGTRRDCRPNHLLQLTWPT